MSKFKFNLDIGGVRELRKSAEMQSIIKEYADNCASKANGQLGEEGYSANMRVASTRCVATVRPETPHAYYSNLKNNTLLKSLR